jgi:nicotinate-nucleotide adenylyltransferase
MRAGILGGTFDPVHIGHLLLAEQAREALALDQVILVPAARPPHKPGRVLTPFDVRLEMVRLAIGEAETFAVSGIERDPARPSWTVETLRRLRAAPGAPEETWLLLGADSLEELPTWREPEEIVRMARLAVYPRPGWDAATLETSLSPSQREWRAAGRLVLLDGPRLALSSSEIRDRARCGRSLRFLVPEPVRAYITAHGLYREDPPVGPRECPGGDPAVTGGVPPDSAGRR